MLNYPIVRNGESLLDESDAVLTGAIVQLFPALVQY